MERWIAAQRERAQVLQRQQDACRFVAEMVRGAARWAQDRAQVMPDMNDTAWKRLTPDGILDAFKQGLHAGVPDASIPTANCARRWTRSSRWARAAAPCGRPHRAPHDGTESAQAPVRLRRHAGAPEGALEGANGEALRKRIVDQYPGGAGRRIPGYLARPVPHLQPAVPGGGQRSGARPVPDRRPEAVDLRLPRRRHPQLPVRAQRHRRPPLPARHQLPLDRRVVEAVNQLFRTPRAMAGHPGYAPAPSASARPGQSAAVRAGRRQGGASEQLVGVDGPLPGAGGVHAGPRT
jgi:exodeoxyribonuclease V beta subunit